VVDGSGFTGVEWYSSWSCVSILAAVASTPPRTLFLQKTDSAQPNRCNQLTPISTPQGKLTSFSPASGKFTLKYDDGQNEQLLIERERTQWHGPRAASAGYTAERHAAMAALGVEGAAPAGPVRPPPAGAADPRQRVPLAAAEMVGWRLRLWFGGDGSWHAAEVLAYDDARRLHHLLYLDGEHEWVEIAKEAVRWEREPVEGGAVSAGVVQGASYGFWSGGGFLCACFYFLFAICTWSSMAPC
jgi:hypothetical protein